MDINDIRSVITVISLALFLSLVAWVWSGRRRAAFEEAARLPFADGEDGTESAGGEQ